MPVFRFLLYLFEYQGQRGVVERQMGSWIEGGEATSSINWWLVGVWMGVGSNYYCGDGIMIIC
jgi:hypothetical protein